MIKRLELQKERHIKQLETVFGRQSKIFWDLLESYINDVISLRHCEEEGELLADTVKRGLKE